MRLGVLAVPLLLAMPARAEKPAPLGMPWSGPRGVIDGLPAGKPAPLSADDAATEGDHPDASGTGFVVASGKVLTNRHVVDKCARVVARPPGGARLPATVVTTDAKRDLALLSVADSVGPPLAFRDGPPVRRGEAVITYGYPLFGLLSSGPSLTTGNISALAGLRDNPAQFQISAAVQPGSSGGPLFDSRGSVIGVVVSKLNAARVAQLTGGDIPQNVNFAVKGEEALAFLRANGVSPRVAPGDGPERRPDEVDAIANPSTVHLQCFR